MPDLIDGLNTIQDNYEKYKDMFTTEKNDVVTMDSFYQLLIAEMQNQDPLEPTSNTEFISQMATFTSLQAQQDNFKMQQQNYAKSLIGQVVGVNTGGEELYQGTVTHVTYGDDIMVNIDGKGYPLDSVKLVYGEAETIGNQIGSYGSFATGLIGKEVTVKGTDANGVGIFDSGLVTAVEVQEGMVRVIINGYAYNATDVVSVVDPVTKADNTANNNINELIEKIDELIEKTESEAIADITGGDDDKNTAEEAKEEAAEELVDYTSETDIEDLADDEDDLNELYGLFQ